MSFDLEKGLSNLLSVQTADSDSCSEPFYRFYSGLASEQEQKLFRQHQLECDLCRRDGQEMERVLEAKRSTIALSTWSQPRWLALAASIVIVVSSFALLWLRDSSPPTARIKGFSFQVAVKRADKEFVAQSGAELQPGDTLGFFASTQHDGKLLLLSADQNENLKSIFPADGWAEWPAGNEQAIPDGAEVERVNKCEWLIALFTTRSPPSIETVRAEFQQAFAKRSQACVLPPIELKHVHVNVFTYRGTTP